MLKSKRGKAAEWVICERCNSRFLKEVCNIRHSPNHFCSRECVNNTASTETFLCAECGEPVLKQASQKKKSSSGRSFCCQSHAATFNNRLRQKTRRSKIEIKFYERLSLAFPDLQMIPNDKEMLSGFEVDIAIPELNLAIEWNGVVHFQPIYGQEKLEIIQRRDAEKSLKATELGIRLIVISDADSSKKTLERAYTEVHSIIESLVGLAGADPAISTPPA